MAGTIGFGPDGSPGAEDTPPAPISRENLYLRSKLLASDGLREFAARTGLDVVEVLPGWMFGPWDAAPTTSGRIVLDFLAGRLPPIPPGGLNAVDARDVARGMIEEHGRPGDKYILAGAFVTVADVIHALAEITGRHAPRARVPYQVALAFAAFAQAWARITGGETLVTTAGVRMMNARLRVTSARAERELGWRARPLGETLRDEIAWYRGQGMTTDLVPGRAAA
jgi:dihydroflavonol-4-reductase